MTKGVYHRDPTKYPFGRVVWTPERDRQVQQMYLGGRSQTEIAKHFRTSASRIRGSLKRTNTVSRPVGSQPGSKNPSWKGGRSVDPDGYVLIWKPGHPSANSGGYVREHRLVMEDALGRYLLREEVVHHKNKDKQDNHLENLELFSSNGEHLAEELKGRCPKWTEAGRQKTVEAHQRWCEEQRKKNRSRNGGRRSRRK